MRIVQKGKAPQTLKAQQQTEEQPAQVPSAPFQPLFSEEYLKYINQVLSQQPLDKVLEWCYRSLPNLFQVTSFGSVGMVIIHTMRKLNMKIPVIFINTLYHFAETLEHAKQVESDYNLTVSWYRCPQASTREEFEQVFGSKDMWISDPPRYEQLTKVEPLERALNENKVSAWITGRRRDQGGLRTDLQIIEVDPADGRIKVNPLAHWSKDEVWGYLRNEGVPYNPLYDQSYTSIGDAVNTTKNTEPEKGERAGRFYQFEGTKTECGIHTRRRQRKEAAQQSSGNSENIVNSITSGVNSVVISSN